MFTPCSLSPSIILSSLLSKFPPTDRSIILPVSWCLCNSDWRRVVNMCRPWSKECPFASEGSDYVGFRVRAFVFKQNYHYPCGACFTKSTHFGHTCSRKQTADQIGLDFQLTSKSLLPSSSLLPFPSVHLSIRLSFVPSPCSVGAFWILSPFSILLNPPSFFDLMRLLCSFSIKTWNKMLRQNLKQHKD